MIRPTVDVRDVLRRWNDAPEQFDDLLSTALLISAQEGVGVMARLTNEGATRNLVLGWHAVAPRKLGTGIVSSVKNATPYAGWVDKGRGPGKMPPYDAIEHWVQHKLGAKASGVDRERGHLANERRARKARKQRAVRRARTIAPPPGTSTRDRNISRESLIFLIRRKIADHGTFTPKQPPNFVEKGTKALRPVVTKHVYAALAQLESRLSSP